MFLILNLHYSLLLDSYLKSTGIITHGCVYFQFETIDELSQLSTLYLLCSYLLLTETRVAILEV